MKEKRTRAYGKVCLEVTVEKTDESKRARVVVRQQNNGEMAAIYFRDWKHFVTFAKFMWDVVEKEENGTGSDD